MHIIHGAHLDTETRTTGTCSSYRSSDYSILEMQWSAFSLSYLDTPSHVVRNSAVLIALDRVVMTIIGPLKELQDGSRQKSLSRLASSTLRRPIRIFGPPIIGSFLVLLCVRLGFFTPGNMTYPGWIHFGYPEYRPPIFETTLEQLQHWYQTTSIFVWVFTFDTYRDYPYDGHLWTIPIEFRYSLIVFLLVLGVSKTRLLYRITILALSVAYCIWVVSWEGTLFISGVLLAQITLVRESRNRRNEPWDDEAVEFLLPKKNSAARSKKRLNFTNLALFLFALYLASVPDWNRKKLGA
jgi:peptidoglycan/LPS O-acetylase OafA/YrhL